jgi:hypothetical protein
VQKAFRIDVQEMSRVPNELFCMRCGKQGIGTSFRDSNLECVWQIRVAEREKKDGGYSQDEPRQVELASVRDDRENEYSKPIPSDVTRVGMGQCSRHRTKREDEDQWKYQILLAQVVNIAFEAIRKAGQI